MFDYELGIEAFFSAVFRLTSPPLSGRGLPSQRSVKLIGQSRTNIESDQR
jgi:hypothetical protein